MTGYVPRDYMDAAIEAVFADFAAGKKSTLLVMATGVGKCLAKGTPVLMWDASIKTVEDIEFGDQIAGPDSSPRTVLSVTSGREAMFRVTPIKGDPYTVNESHILSLKMTTGNHFACAGEIVNISVRDYLSKSNHFRHCAKGYRVGIEWPEQDVPLDPYFLGVWLGDGSRSRPQITSNDPEIVEYLETFAVDQCLRLHHEEYTGRCKGYAVSGTARRWNPVTGALRSLKVYQDKHVPLLYKCNSRDIRLELLAGLIDTDGSRTNGGFEFVNKSQKLAEDCAFVARSLGLAAYIKPCEKYCQTGGGGVYYRVGISGDCSIVPVKIARKKADARNQKKDVLVTGITVEPVGDGDYYGFTIDGDGLFLLGDFTVTHNTEAYLQIAERYIKENSPLRCMAVAHREELITQPARRWKRNREEWPAIDMGTLRAEVREQEDELFEYAPTNDRFVLASIPTLNSGSRCANCTADCQECEQTGKIFSDCGCESGCDDCRGTGKIKSKCKPCGGDGWICTYDDCDLCFEHFTRRMQKFNAQDFGLIIIDEAHHAVAATYTRMIRYFRSGNPDVLVLGLTATPDRTDEEAMGQVFESVCYVYNLPTPIFDGWLTPIDQQFVTVDDLNLANVRVTAGDLNSGDLEREMTAEKVLHKVTTPLVEIACGLEKGTIDRLLKENKLDKLLGLCGRREPTLVHCVDVAHAERTTEIINRYLPDSALCIIGTTDKTIRREGLKRFADGGFQFLLSCGVFLEGTDLPNVSVIGMARPTKSRSLYSQMLGRGLRPVSGLVDGIPDAESRVAAIADSIKKKCLVIDFVGNSGRHKLISAADILGNEMPDDLVNGVIRKAAVSGQPVDILKALAEAQIEEEARARKQAREDASKREAAQQAAERRAALRRQGIVAGATYDTQQINPFDVMDVAPQREPGWHKGRMPSEAMKETLRKAKVPFSEQTTFWEAHLIIDEICKRRQDKKCTFSQAKTLKKHGYSGDMTFVEASATIDALAKNGWKRPAEPTKNDLPF